jgi:putative transposase
MGRLRSCFDNAAAESFFISLEWEVLVPTRTTNARTVVID